MDIEFHRIGVDLIHALVKQAAAKVPERSPADGGDGSDDGGTVHDTTQEAAPEIRSEALGLFVVLLQMFAETTYQGRRFNKLVVFDEAHKYIDSPDLVAGLVEVVREMRHKGTSIMVASQDPPSVPTSLIELSTQIILHKFNSPAWLKHIQKANAALDGLTPAKLASLGPGEAYVWSSKSTDDAFVRGAVKVQCRPRVTQHGGGTKTAVVPSDVQVQEA